MCTGSSILCIEGLDLRNWPRISFSDESHFFSKLVMDETAYTCVEMRISPLSAYMKLTDLWWKRQDNGSSILQPQNKPSPCPRKFNGLTL
jgi:hypothetical protein